MRLQEREWERAATVAIWLLSPHRKRGSAALTARKLMGRNLVIWPTLDDGDR